MIGHYYMRLLQRVEGARDRSTGLHLDAEDVGRLANMLELGEASRIAEAYDLDDGLGTDIKELAELERVRHLREAVEC